jgi:hypothetical protein
MIGNLELIKQIDAHRCLFLTDLREPADGSLRLVIEEGKAGGPGVDLDLGDGVVLPGSRPIEIDESCAAYEVLFEGYIAYAVRDESFTIADDEEVFDGTLFCIYSQSKFLDFVAASTFADDQYPGSFTHYGLNCLNHIVDVASPSSPRILRIR